MFIHLQEQARQQVPLKRWYKSNRLHVSNPEVKSFIYYYVPGNARMHVNMQTFGHNLDI